MDDEYGADDGLLEAMAAVDSSAPARKPIQQPIPQRLDRRPPAASGASVSKGVVQPTPQSLPQRSSGSTILVSPRQRGNPLLACLRSIPWEYSDIPADYVLGLTTCALFLSLKYHRLHPEYIYTRIRNLQGKYNLRIILTLVDIPNHEDSLRELSKTSMVNNATIILCWSAAEAARYLELYKSYENANFAAIRGQQSTSYTDRLVDFVTVPRSLNKSDAVALVANFGSLRNAINAEPEHLALLNGWGGVKVKRWKSALEEPFRAKNAAKREAQGASAASSRREAGAGRPLERGHEPSSHDSGKNAIPAALRVSRNDAPQSEMSGHRSQFRFHSEAEDEEDEIDEDEAAMLSAAIEESKKTSQARELPKGDHASAGQRDDELSGGIAAALAKLRESG